MSGESQLSQDFSVPADNIGVRILGGAIVERQFSRGLAERWKNDALLLQKFFVSHGVLVDTHTQNKRIPRFNVLLKPVEGRRFLDAGRTPGGPEIQYDHFAFQIGEVPWFPPNFQGKVLCGLARYRGFALPVRGHGEEHQNQRGDTNCRPGPDFSNHSHQMLY